MKHEIIWMKPSEFTPPFHKRILVLVEGTWGKYVRVIDAVITQNSPNDNYEGSEFHQFLYDGNFRDGGNFLDFQFYVAEYDDYFISECSEDLYSDAILAWAEIPDFSEALK